MIHVMFKLKDSLDVNDQGFPLGGGVQPSRGRRQHTILPKFAKNVMKLKEFGCPGEACICHAPYIHQCT